MTPEEFRVAGHALIDWIADHRARIPDLPVAAWVGPGDIAGALPSTAPTGGEAIDALLEDLTAIVVPGVTQTQHPSFFGWFPSNASLSSVLGDIASGGIAALGITWASAPALTEMEQVVTDWLRQECGLSSAWRGAIQDTASTGALVALLAARERASDMSKDAGGLQQVPAPLVIYTSPHAHSSVDKAALLAGFGRDNIRLVDVDPSTYAMDPAALASAMAEDVAQGRRPAAVVAAVGTTGTTAMDPIDGIVRVAAEQDAWVHVDAAMAGAAMLLPERRHLFAGIEGADSLTWNPHKWFGTILDTSLLYVRDIDHLVAVMSTTPSYLRSPVDNQVVQYKDWGIPLGRRFRALKLWFQLRLDGLDEVRARLRRDLDNAAWLAGQVADTPQWRVLAPVTLQTVCLRHEPLGSDGLPLGPEALDAHTQAWAQRVNESGQAFVTTSLLDDRWMVRVSIGAEPTQRSDVESLWALLRHTAETEPAATSAAAG
ncbi:MAG: pyridoxal phosphate-dependent decarboxylase family protein [Nostocoides sp.]